MNSRTFVLGLCACCLPLFWQPASAHAAEQTFETTYLIPEYQSGIQRPSLLLNGTWDFKYTEKDRWEPILVPGEPAMQGYAIRHDQPFFYRKVFTVPADFKGQTVILRFDGVYSHARLFVNGKFVREHFGGFSRWETDVTDFVKAGRKNEIRLEVTDRLDEISYASGYAHHPIGGILRDVTLFALPENHPADFHLETDLDAQYQDAVLRVRYQMNRVAGEEVVYTLLAPDGREVKLPQARFALKSGMNSQDLQVTAPLKWDAEHPNLYTLHVQVVRDGQEVCRFCKRVGFREVEIRKDQMFVNGMPVKLRGACRHDIHPKLGRTTTAELDSLDVLLFKRSNMNFVRTSHYPPSEHFLDYCDRFGVYVECESAVCFVDTHRQKNYAPGKTQDSTAFTHRYLSQLREMVKSFRSHASILFWSIGNESVYGKNFQQSWDWVKATDTTRPVIFSYPGSLGDRQPIYDLLSMHYQDVHGNLNQWNRSTRGFEGEGIPAIFDEWAHPACYTYETLQTDPNIREFWGQSLEMMWSGLFDARGGLGGAIWGYIDETFQLPEPKKGTPFWKEFAHTAKPEGFRGNCVGYGEWGIVDVWRREKPEFWSTKKAYSPVRLLEREVASVLPGERLILPVYNRFDHTSLQEIKVVYSYAGKEGNILSPAVAPHQKGVLVVPGEDWKEGTAVEIAFYTAQGELIDKEQVSLGKPVVTLPRASRKGALTVEESDDFIRVKGQGFEIPFSRQSGLIEKAVADGQVVIEKGPFLHLFINLNHLSGAEVRKTATRFVTDERDWKKESLTYTQRNGMVEVTLTGTYQDVQTTVYFTIAPTGKMHVRYQTSGEPNGYLRETGLAFHLPDSYRQLEWQRKGLWSCYPEDALSGNAGRASLYNPNRVAYGEEPKQPWADDTHNYYYWADAGANADQPLTNRAKAMKENIYFYTLRPDNPAGNLSVCSADATLSCRLYKRDNNQLVLYVDDRWDYPEIAWGNYCKTLEAVPCQGFMEFVF